MIQIIAESHYGTKEHPLPIGQSGEHLARTVVFKSLKTLREIYKKTGTWTIVLQRPYEKNSYVAANQWESEEGYACWDVSDVDTEIVGLGKVELRFYPDGDETSNYKSKIWITETLKSLREGYQPKEKEEELIETLTDLSEDLEDLVERAEEISVDLQIDDHLSTESENPVQNKVVTEALLSQSVRIGAIEERADEELFPGWSEVGGRLSISANGTYHILVNVQGDPPIYEVGPLYASENGIYHPEDEGLTGYDEVTVSVPGLVPTGTKEITSNGIYDVTSFASASVSVPGLVPSGTKEINENGIYDIKTFASVSVAVAGSGGDDFVSTIERTVISLTASNISSIGHCAFAYCSALTTISFPACTYIGNNAFLSCSALTEASFPACTYIGYNAFRYCSALTTASFPVCASIGSSTFESCSALTNISFPACISIGNSAFNYCKRLSKASFPACSYIEGYAFTACSSLTSISFPVCKSIGNYAFRNCAALTSVSFPSCTSIGTGTFYSCSALTSVSFPVCNFIGPYAFTSCSALAEASFPVCTSIGSYVFRYCSALTSVSFPACSYIGSWAFAYCYNLKSLYLTSNKIVSLPYSNAFSSTPIDGYTEYTGGVYGSIYVPRSLYGSYKTGINWSYYSSRFVSV